MQYAADKSTMISALTALCTQSDEIIGINKKLIEDGLGYTLNRIAISLIPRCVK